jgi:hypothetical protein
MTFEQIAISALAAVVALWPNLAGMAEKAAAGVGGLVADKLVTPHTPAPAAADGSYHEAIADLANVRTRLLKTELLLDPQKAAIDTLTLALVGGSDKP